MNVFSPRLIHILGIHYVLPLVFLFFIPNFSIGQLTIEWDKTYGGSGWEELQDMIPTYDGYLFFGMTSSGISGDVSQISRGGTDFWIVKTDKQGEKIWDRRYGGDGLDRLWFGIQTSDGGFVLGGGSESNENTATFAEKSEPCVGSRDFFFIRIDENGDVIFDKTFGSKEWDVCQGILETPEGGYLLAGYSAESDTLDDKTERGYGGDDFWVIKTDIAGNMLWNHVYGGDKQDRCFTLKYAHDGGYIMGGFSKSGVSGVKTDSLRGVNDIWVIKIDEDGTMQWDLTLGGDDEETLADIIPTYDNGYLLCGFSRSGISGDKTTSSYGEKDFWIIKIDVSGNVLWQKSYGGDGNDTCYSGRENGTGNFLIIGVSESGNTGTRTDPNIGGMDFWVLYIDHSGNLLWDKAYGGTENDSPPRIYFSPDGGYVIGGHSSSNMSEDKSEDSKGMNDFWILKTHCPLIPPNIPDTTVCANEPVSYDVSQPSCPDCIYEWVDGFAFGERIIKTPADIELNVTLFHPDGCSISDTFSINVNEIPEITGTSSLPVTCFGYSNGIIVIESVIDGIPPYTYKVDESDFTSDNVFYSLSPQVHEVFVKDSIGCIAKTKVLVQQPNEFIIDIGDEIEVHLGDSLQLNITSTEPIDTFFWSNPSYLPCTDCLNPVIHPTETRHYLITGYSESGCESKDLLLVKVIKPRNVFIPNVFSPNSDGNNDYFMIRGNNDLVNIKSLQIFDRFGKPLYSVKNLSPYASDEEGWNGKFHDANLSSGVYIYMAVLEFYDGIEELVYGDITLLR